MENNETILIIDDEPAVLNTIASILKDKYTVRPVLSGNLAFKYLERHHADLIILDQQMPEISGLEVLTLLRKDNKYRKIPVIFHTSDGEGSSEIEALDMGAVDYLKKPIHAKILSLRVRLQIELQKHRRNLEELVEEKTKRLNDTNILLKQREESTLNILAKVTDMRDQKTGDHVERTTKFVEIMVSSLMKEVDEEYRLDKETSEEIIASAKLHDIGKIAIPDRILLKPGKLTEEEFGSIKAHPIRGRALLEKYAETKEDSFLNTACDITYYHHEKWNGSGYPEGKKGKEIPLSARIVAIADVYDALTSERPYKDAMSHETATSIIREERGRQFDPFLTDLFIKHECEFEEVLLKAKKGKI